MTFGYFQGAFWWHLSWQEHMKQEQLAYMRSHLMASVEFAAQVLDLTPAGVRAGIRRGQIPGAGVGRHEKVPTKFLLQKTGYATEAEAA